MCKGHMSQIKPSFYESGVTWLNMADSHKLIVSVVTYLKSFNQTTASSVVYSEQTSVKNTPVMLYPM